MNPDLQNAVCRLIDAGCYYRLDALATCYSRPPKASYGVAPLTGHPKKWRSHFLGKPAPYNRVLSSATRLV